MNMFITVITGADSDVNKDLELKTKTNDIPQGQGLKVSRPRTWAQGQEQMPQGQGQGLMVSMPMIWAQGQGLVFWP